MSSGIGSNDLGLDRGRLNDSKVVKFVKAGKKLLLIQPNYDYRATTTNPEKYKQIISELPPQGAPIGMD